jgi:general secretion pathway protein D
MSLPSPIARWPRALLPALVLGGLLAGLPAPAFAQDDPPTSTAPRPRPPDALRAAREIELNFVDADLSEVVKRILEDYGENFILPDPKAFKEKITIYTKRKVSGPEAWEGFLNALAVHGYTVVKVGQYWNIIKINEAVQAPIRIRSGDATIPASDQVITQIIPLANVNAGDISSIVNAMKSPGGNIIAYQPSNTLIITDRAHIVRKINDLINELDVAAPKSTMEIVRLRFADAAEVQQLIEQLYSVGSSTGGSAEQSNMTPAQARLAARRRSRQAEPEAATADALTAGKESNYIDKVIADARTNSLVILANEQGHKAVLDLIAKVDIDATDNSRSQIHVVRLEQAKAQDVVDVLSRLSEGARTGGATAGARTPTARAATAANAGASGAGATEETGAIAAFDSGMRIAHDESTNSLVIIASPEDFRVVKQVIDELDRVRKEVFVDAVIMEISSDDDLSFSMGAHAPQGAGEDSVGFLSGQLGTRSFGFSTDLLSGLAMGVFGPATQIPLQDGSTLNVPAFGIVLQAIQTYSSSEIISNPQLVTLDNEEAKIVVGRKVPFPTNAQFNQFSGQPIVTFTREDVATTLEITPRINSANYVTLEVRVEVSEVEPGTSGADALLSGGPVTSKREVETTALVADNQTIVIGGLVGTTETEAEIKVPILGDIPLIGALFRGTTRTSRKSNLVIFLTPHIIEGPDDMLEIMRVKEAQFREFRRRFYGQSREEAYRQMQDLLQYSMNIVDRESVYRGTVDVDGLEVDGAPITPETASAIQLELDRAGRTVTPGAGAGDLPGPDAAPVVPAVPVDGTPEEQ